MKNEFKPGFRLFYTDILFLILAATTVIYLSNKHTQLSIIIVFVVGHFFLYCNIIRMSRKPELIWAFLFLALNLANLYFSKPSFIMVLSLSFISTLILVVLEMRKDDYHGIGWSKINPELRKWWENNR